VVSDSLPEGSETLLLIMAISGVATWYSSNIYNNLSFTRAFALIGIASAIVLITKMIVG